MEKSSLTEKFPNRNTRSLLGERLRGWSWEGRERCGREGFLSQQSQGRMARREGAL